MTADLRIGAVIDAVCEVCGISPGDLRKRSRAEPLPTARALVAHFLYRDIRLNPREILPLVCHPDYKRTAVYHYLGRRTLVEIKSPFQKELRLKVEAVRQRLG